MMYITGILLLAAVQRACIVIMALPSPIIPITFLSGLANLTPMVAPIPHPIAPPRSPNNFFGLKLFVAINAGLEDTESSMIITSSDNTSDSSENNR